MATVEIAQPALISTHVRAFDGWNVTVNGLPADIEVVDGVFLGVAVAEGSHVIEFRYQPSWWWPAVIVALGALTTAVVLVSRRRITS